MKISRLILAVALVAIAASSDGAERNVGAGADQPVPAGVSGYTGRVIETMDAGSYTYAQVDTGTAKIWVAAPKVDLEVGAEVFVSAEMPMANFYSATLSRTFELIYFVDALGKAGAAGPAPHPSPELGDPHGGSNRADVDLSGIEKAKGGKSIEELFANKKSLSGQPVVVRGKVVQFKAGILGKNWLHIRDGTGTPGSDDLTCTSDATVAVGDTVLVRGVLSVDKDFGFGYKYDLIIEDAGITVE